LQVQPIRRVWRPHRPVPIASILGTVRRGAGDPTYAGRGGSVWRGIRTPCGTASLALAEDRAAGTVRAVAWGEGAAWACEHVPAMLGGLDNPDGFEPKHPQLIVATRRHPHWRVPRSGLVFEAAVAAAIEQRVTGHEAFTGWRLLVRRHGEPAPGPPGERGLMVLPSPHTIRQIPSWEWLAMHVDPARSATVMRVAGVAESLERTLGLGAAAAESALRSVPGVGVWTAAEVRQRAHGDADAVSFGDYHIASSVGLALTGEPVDDLGMARLLDQYRPHRYRVQRLVELSGVRAARRGPRMTPRRHLPAARIGR
jgi:3-methyladenine DNA glycosylase/8-oxoguanine DNA glycosylase